MQKIKSRNIKLKNNITQNKKREAKKLTEK